MDFQALAATALAVVLYMSLLFLVALRKKDNSIVDIGWGPGFVLVALLTLFWAKASGAIGHTAVVQEESASSLPMLWGNMPGDRQLLVTGLVLVWGLRLGIHIWLRKRGKPEDFRYAAWRKAWGRSFVVRSFFQIFMLQGLFLLLVSWPVWWVNLSPGRGLTPLDAAGAAVWLVGFLFEAVGDAQMERFKRDPANKGRIIDRGLWRFTRHPNYFGEAAMWWGLFLIALSAPGGWTAAVSPVLITFLLLRVSGIPMLERKYAGRPDWEEYARRTSRFFPRLPKR
ncbi:MAG: DUF1295 domain-containing protein [Candidatus Aminicenantes bacterium]|nr:DUF1295 domain-containing protein [Candidatus Aminicenantes bacterium]